MAVNDDRIGASIGVKGPLTLDELQDFIDTARANRPPRGAMVEVTTRPSGGFLLTIAVLSLLNPKADT